MKNFLTTSDFSRAELEEILELAQKFKKDEVDEKPLNGKSVALVFLTRVCGHALRCRSEFMNSAETR